MKSLAQNPIDPAKNEDARLRGELLHLAARLHKLQKLQEEGLGAIPEHYSEGAATMSLRGNVRTLLDELQEHGLFLVPVGELESWLPILMKGHSREDKSRWAMLAAEKIEDSGERNEGLWQFIRTLYDFLQKQLGNFVGVSPHRVEGKMPTSGTATP